MSSPSNNDILTTTQSRIHQSQGVSIDEDNSFDDSLDIISHLTNFNNHSISCQTTLPLTQPIHEPIQKFPCTLEISTPTHLLLPSTENTSPKKSKYTHSNPCISERLKQKTYATLPPHPTLTLNHIPQKPRTKNLGRNLTASLTQTYNPSLPFTNEDAGQEIPNVAAALTGPEVDQWWAAMQSEIQSINEKGTWILVPRPKDRQVIINKWLLRRKLNPN